MKGRTFIRHLPQKLRPKRNGLILATADGCTIHLRIQRGPRPNTVRCHVFAPDDLSVCFEEDAKLVDHCPDGWSIVR